MPSAIHATIPSLTPVSSTNHLLLTLTVIWLIFFSEQECCYLVLTKIQSVCNYLCTSLIIQAIYQMLLKCKHGHCHHILYLFLLNKHSSSFFEVFLIGPFFCLQKTEYIFQLHFSKACGYIHTYTHTRGWGGGGVLACWGRDRHWWGQREIACMCMKADTTIARLESMKRGNCYTAL